MNKIVAHFTRKEIQLKTVFINAQIQKHIHYKPVVVFKYPSRKNESGFAEYNRDDIPKLNLSDESKFIFNFYYLKKICSHNVNKTLEFLKVNNVSILHFHFGTDAYIYCDVIRLSGLPSVVSFYGYDIGSAPKKIFGLGKKLLQNGAFKYATKMLAMSPDMANDLKNAGCPKEKILTHYYGVPTHLFKGINRKYCQREKIKLLIIGNLQLKKGHLFILSALKLLVQSGVANFTFDIVGAGPIENKLKKFCNDFYLQNHVNFLGAAKFASEKMMNALESADIFIHPSVKAKSGDKEGIPGTIVEAMASGLPVVSTYHAGIPYVIENEVTGLLVNEWDVDALATQIKRLIENRDLREQIGTAARKFAVKNLDVKIKEEELEKIYDSLVS